jgi:Domain of unknown function (DUF5122) beta-propeller
VIAVCVLGLAGLSSVAQALTNSPLQTWQANGRVSAISAANGVVYLGGQFTAMISPTGQVVGRAHLAAVDETTGQLLSWNPGANGPVDALRESDGVVYAGGSFTRAGGQPRSNIAAFHTSGGVVSTWQPASDGPVDAIAVSGSTVYLGGSFAHVDGAARIRLAAVTTSGVLRSNWKPTADAIVRSMTVDGSLGRVYVGGDFTHISGATEPYLAALSPLTGAVDAWSNHPTGRVWGLAIDGTNLYAAVGGHVPAGEVAAFNATTGGLLWSRWTDGDAQAIAASNGSVYVGGHFINVCATNSGSGSPWVCTQPIARSKLAQFAESDGTLQPWNPPCDSQYGVWALRATTTHILIGGDFTHVNNQHHWHYAEFLR